MTVEAFVPTPPALIDGTGPYPVLHPYKAGALMLEVVQDGTYTLLEAGDWTADPPEAEDDGGAVTLSGPAATTYAGGTLYITRGTQVEQGWQGTANSREKGLEAALDWSVQGIQDAGRARQSGLRALGVTGPAGVPVIFEPDRVLIGSTDGGGIVPGPDLSDIDTLVQISADAGAVLAELSVFLARSVAVAALDGLSGATNRIGWLDEFGRAHYVVRSQGAMVIPDMPGWVPDGKLFVQHLGVRADMTWELQQIYGIGGVFEPDTWGPVRLTGTDQRDLLQAADDYAAATNQPLYFRDGGYYWVDQINIAAQWISENDFGATLWSEVRNKVVASDFREDTPCGAVLVADGACLGDPDRGLGFKIIGQGAWDGSKEINGARGLIVRMGDDYYTTDQQPVYESQRVRALMVRAAVQRDGTGNVTQLSKGAIYIAAMGGHSNPRVQLGTFAQTNIQQQYQFLSHWNAWFDGAKMKATGEIRDLVGGSGYSGNFPVVSTGGGAGVAVPMSGTAIVESGAVVDIAWDELGDWSNMTERPTIDWSAGDGSGASATLVYGVDETQNLTLVLPEEAYHAINGTLKFLTPLRASTHRFQAPWELAGTGPWDVYRSETYGMPYNETGDYGGGLGVVSCGDLCNALAIDEQKEWVGKGIRVWSPLAKECFSSTASQEALLIKMLGTSKAWEDFEPGSRVLQQRQLEMDVLIDNPQAHYRDDQDVTAGAACYIYFGKGRIRIPGLKTTGIQKALMALNFHGRCEVGLSGDGAIDWRNSTGLVSDDIAVDRRDVTNAADTDDFAFGYGNANSCVARIMGETSTLGTTENAQALGDTSIELAAPLATAVYEGDNIVFDDGGTEKNRVKVTGNRATGSGFVAVTPLTEAMSAGATVSRVQRASAVFNHPAFRSSANGIIADQADVVVNDMSDVAYTGRRLGWLKNAARMEVRSGELPFTGRASAAGTLRRSFRLEDGSNLLIDGVRMRSNPAVTSHLQTLGTSHVGITNSQIEDVVTLGSGSNAWGQLSFNGNTDFLGNLLTHPGASIEALPLLKIGDPAVAVGTGSYSSRNGTLYYHKDGWREWIVDFTLASRDGLTGNLTIDLPEASATRISALVLITNSNLTSTPAVLQGSGTNLTFQRQASAGLSTLDHAQIDDTSRFIFVARWKV